MLHLFGEGITGDGGKFGKVINVNMFYTVCCYSFTEEVCGVTTYLTFFCHGF
jgi:hypothetical protein